MRQERTIFTTADELRSRYRPTAPAREGGGPAPCRQVLLPSPGTHAVGRAASLQRVICQVQNYDRACSEIGLILDRQEVYVMMMRGIEWTLAEQDLGARRQI